MTVEDFLNEIRSAVIDVAKEADESQVPEVIIRNHDPLAEIAALVDLTYDASVPVHYNRTEASPEADIGALLKQDKQSIFDVLGAYKPCERAIVIYATTCRGSGPWAPSALEI